MPRSRFSSRSWESFGTLRNQCPPSLAARHTTPYYDIQPACTHSCITPLVRARATAEDVFRDGASEIEVVAVALAMGVGAGPGALLGTEVCATLLLLCWLCCWPDDSNSESGSRRRSGELLSRRVGNSAASLHLPSTSGYAKQSLSAHRSHEEIRSRRKSHHETADSAEARYHSAPSVIDEVLHRRDWERSTKDLYIPLNPENEVVKSESSPSLAAAPYADAESSSIECLKPEDHRTSKCKKHHSNIKSSKGKKCKESNRDDIKDTDATEAEISNFYIGDAHDSSLLTRADPSPSNQIGETDEIRNQEWIALNEASTSNYQEFIENERLSEDRNRSIYKAKDAKQSFNESIRLKELPRKGLAPLAEGEVRSFGFCVADDIDGIDAIDRSGAVHHTIESRMSLRQYPPPSVETVGYEGGACYLAEVGSVSELRSRIAESMSPHALGAALHALEAGVTSLSLQAGVTSLSLAAGGTLRARHASDGDILAPPQRPESGAFSESDLDLDVESEERPPDYDEVQLYGSPKKKETAI